MASSRPGRRTAGAWGSGNAAQRAWCRDHGDHDDQGNPSIPQIGDYSRNEGKGHPTPPRKRQRQRTKKQIALSLLERSKGASIVEMQDAMGWQPHSVRGFLAATIKKMPGVILTSEKIVGRPRRYHIEAAGE